MPPVIAQMMYDDLMTEHSVRQQWASDLAEDYEYLSHAEAIEQQIEQFEQGGPGLMELSGRNRARIRGATKFLVPRENS